MLQTKKIFAKPYNLSAIKADLIKYGKDIGMTHIANFDKDFGGGQITPEVLHATA